MAEGVWRTVMGRKVFIADGQSLGDAMKTSGVKDVGKGDSGGKKSDLKVLKNGLTQDGNKFKNTTESGGYFTIKGRKAYLKKGETYVIEGDGKARIEKDQGDSENNLKKIEKADNSDKASKKESTLEKIDATKPLSTEQIESLKESKTFIKSVDKYIEGSYSVEKGDRLDSDMAKDINDFIDKNPDAHWSGGELYRGTYMTDKEVAMYEENLKFDMRGFSSWTHDSGVAEEFYGEPDGYADTLNFKKLGNGLKLNSVIFVDKTKGSRSAISVESLAKKHDFDYQKEVIYSGNSSFKVLKVESKSYKIAGPSSDIDTKLYTIYVEEK